ncbi:GNAT family N-acetyltransferase [Nostoc sp.]
MQKIGMQQEGYLRQHHWIKGEWRDSWLYAILEHEWRGVYG